MKLKRVSQGWIGRGYWSIGLAAWPFELIPAVILAFALSLVLLTISVTLAYPFILIVESLTGIMPENSAAMDFAKDASNLIWGGLPRVLLGIAILYPMVFYRRLLFPRNSAAVLIAILYLLPSMLIFAILQSGSDTSKWLGDGLTDTMINGAAFVYLLTLLPIVAALLWSAVGVATGLVKFPAGLSRFNFSYLKAFPSAFREAVRDSNIYPGLIAGALTIVSVSILITLSIAIGWNSEDLHPLRDWLRHWIPPIPTGYLVMTYAALKAFAPVAALHLWLEGAFVFTRKAAFQHALALIALILAGFLLVWLLSGPLGYKNFDNFGIGFMFLSAAVIIVLIAPCFVKAMRVAAHIAALSDIYARGQAMSGRDVALLLRPFALDKAEVKRSRGLLERVIMTTSKIRLEEVIAALEFRQRPVVALGNPTESYPELGAMRSYCTAETWQPYIQDALSRAQRVLFIIDNTEHTRWETDQILSIQNLDKVVFIVTAPETAARFFLANPELAVRLGLDAGDGLARVLRRALCLFHSNDITTVINGAGRAAFDYTLAYNLAAATLGGGYRARHVIPPHPAA